ncbi:TetR/AcrR family transcriptional regulator [Cytophagales bacterium LB-30]|uniref:TetR/AcrR family transcriptional regulator n=2 Tax=Shiella aurantiaca TaxID=3058365 RepID=A0ABT8F0V5_9BACT|nr:TetR/AcrR family transcriptional regulator [Shiella aurantiaca]
MGVKERKEREKLEKRELILEAAHNLFLERGFDQVSIRNIAEAIEYSPATIYLYFKDKNQIFHALHTEAFRRFGEALYTSQQGIANPMDRLIKMGEAYMHFAINHPEYYDIMFIMKAPMEHVDEMDLKCDWPEGRKTHDYLESLLAECKEHGHFKNTENPYLSLLVWSTMHGLCSLKVRDRLRIYPEESREEMFTKAFDTFKQILLTL